MRLQRFFQVLRLFGARWIAYRAWRALSQRMGLLQRRLPLADWDSLQLSDFLADVGETDSQRYVRMRRNQNVRFFFMSQDRSTYRALLRDEFGHAWCERRLAELEAGRFLYFSDRLFDRGWPPDWHRNPYSGEVAPAESHFSEIDEFAYGDVKAIWELSRFEFTFELARIAWRIDDERCAELFWLAVESWRQANPPYRGINWKCGQESSFRALAWCFGLHAFADSPHTTPQRVAMLAQMLAVTAHRVDATLGYALSQKNNHGISEGAALWTIGLLFPEFKGSLRWRRRGRRVLEDQARKLIYPDGGFSQHSANYHRLMLMVYAWAIRLGECNDQRLSEILYARVEQATRFLNQLLDPVTGTVPVYGQDDGANIFPLSGCEYSDYRPVLQVASLLLGCRAISECGVWDETSLWLFGPEALTRTAAAPAAAHSFDRDGGCHVLRTSRGFAMARCQRYRHRPTQMDQLHVDLWWRGKNLAVDARTYSYNGEGPWCDTPLATAARHNTVTVDGHDQADRISRFMFLPWPDGRMRVDERSIGGRLALLEMEHDGYRRLPDPVTHRRALIRLGDEHWLIADRLTGLESHGYALHWLLCDVEHRWNADACRINMMFPDLPPYAIQAGVWRGDARSSLVRAEPQTSRGWYAPHYLHVEPALSLLIETKAITATYYSVFGPYDWSLQQESNALNIVSSDWRVVVMWCDSQTDRLIASVRLEGEVDDCMECM